jgi:F-type H+-transporting ATPase subunit delta
VAEQLGDFVAAAGSVPELRAMLENPEIDHRAKQAALGELLADADELVRNFLLVIVEKGRAAELQSIHDEFAALVAADERRLEVELTTAYELSDADAREILGQIEKASGRTVDATRKVDPHLIGGFVLQVGSMRVDASVRGRLQRLRQELTKRR